MTTITIPAQPRTDFGKGAARRLRRDGRVPAVIYGHESDVQHVSLPAHELDLALVKPRVVLSVEIEGGATVLAAPRQVQREPVRRIIEHVDLVLLSGAEAKDREAEARLIVSAEAAAEEEGLDPIAVAEAAQAAVADGVKASDAVDAAIAEVKANLVAQTEANAAEAAAEEAAEEAAEAGAEGNEG